MSPQVILTALMDKRGELNCDFITHEQEEKLLTERCVGFLNALGWRVFMSKIASRCLDPTCYSSDYCYHYSDVCKSGCVD